MSAQFPASIVFTNFGNGTNQYQKTVEVDLSTGGLIYVEPGAHQQVGVDIDHQNIVFKVGRWGVGYPDGATPEPPVMQFSFTNPYQHWHGWWSDAPTVRIPIAPSAPTSVFFNSVDDTRTFTITPGRF